MACLSSIKVLSGLTKAYINSTLVLSRLCHGFIKQPITNPSKSILVPFIQLPEYQSALKNLILTRKNTDFLDSTYNSNDVSFYFNSSSFSIYCNSLNSKVSIEEPLHNGFIIEEPINKILPLLTFPKSDIKWRKRRMRRHRLLRWRTKYSQIVRAREEKKLENRKAKQQENLEKSWKMYGLESEPPKLSDEEKSRLVKQWREEGIWNGGLTIDDYKSFAKITSIMRATDEK